MEGTQGAPYATTVRSLTRSPRQVSRFATEKEGGNTRGAIRNHRSIARSLARQVMSHGSPLGRGRLPPSVPHSTTARLLTRSPIHVSRPATGHMEGTQGAPHPTGVRSPTRSPIHVSRLATGRMEGTQGAPYATTVRSLTRSPRQVSRFATEKEGGNTRGAIRNHRSIARSLARQVMSHGSPPATWRGRRRATLIYRSLARSLANLCLAARHWSQGGDTRGVTLHHRSLARSPIHVSLLAIGEGNDTKGAIINRRSFGRTFARQFISHSLAHQGRSHGSPLGRGREHQWRHTQPPVARSLARQVTPHGPPPERGDTRGAILNRHRLLACSPIHVSPLATGEGVGGNHQHPRDTARGG